MKGLIKHLALRSLYTRVLRQQLHLKAASKVCTGIERILSQRWLSKQVRHNYSWVLYTSLELWASRKIGLILPWLSTLHLFLWINLALIPQTAILSCLHSPNCLCKGCFKLYMTQISLKLWSLMIWVCNVCCCSSKLNLSHLALPCSFFLFRNNYCTLDWTSVKYYFIKKLVLQTIGVNKLTHLFFLTKLIGFFFDVFSSRVFHCSEEEIPILLYNLFQICLLAPNVPSPAIKKTL